MAILENFIKKKRYQEMGGNKKQLLSYWTSAETVDCGGNKTLTEKLSTYLPLTGGKVTGALDLGSALNINSAVYLANSKSMYSKIGTAAQTTTGTLATGTQIDILRFDSSNNLLIGAGIGEKNVTSGNLHITGATHIYLSTNSGSVNFHPSKTSTMTVAPGAVYVYGASSFTGGAGFSSTVSVGSTLTINSHVRIKNNCCYMSYDTSGNLISLAALGSDNTQFLSSNSYTTVIRGTAVYLKSNGGTTVTSDQRLKYAIHPLMEEEQSKYETFFDHLNPVIYKYKEGTSGRYHVGAIAQEVEDALSESGLTTMDFAGFKRIPITNDESANETTQELGLCYEEFVMLCVMKIKKLEQKLNALQQ